MYKAPVVAFASSAILRILACAKKEFLEQGYQNANLRKIADEAKATTGALYNHFTNKEVLFDALVKECADTLTERYRVMHEEALQALSNEAKWTNTSSEGTDWVLDYIYDHLDEFTLIFTRSESTKYAHYLDDLSKIEEETYLKMLEMYHKDSEDIGAFFIHVMCASGLHAFYEVVSHGLSKQEAEAFMAQMKRFRFAGWQEILGS